MTTRGMLLHGMKPRSEELNPGCVGCSRAWPREEMACAVFYDTRKAHALPHGGGKCPTHTSRERE